MKEKTCCITGHREIPAGRAAYVERALALEIDRAIEDGFTCFLTGFAEGTDQLFARLVLERARSFRKSASRALSRSAGGSRRCGARRNHAPCSTAAHSCIFSPSAIPPAFTATATAS